MSHKLINDQRGAILLEFTFAVSMLVVIFLASVTMAFLFSDSFDVQKAAREGAKEASITGDVGQGMAKAYQSARMWGLDPARISVEFYSDNFTMTKTCVVQYTSKPFSRTFPKLLNRPPMDDIALYGRATYKH
ncbi:MAG: TadE/TadG family type IV pilus assembly protein [Bacillota bacterium]